MQPNSNVAQQDVIDALQARAIEEVVVESADEDVSPEQLGARAQMRFAELVRPYMMGLDAFVAETVDDVVEDARERVAFADDLAAISADAVVNESMERLERVLGSFEDRDAVQQAVHARIGGAPAPSS